jgi:hypothetical protein
VGSLPSILLIHPSPTSPSCGHSAKSNSAVITVWNLPLTVELLHRAFLNNGQIATPDQEFRARRNSHKEGYAGKKPYFRNTTHQQWVYHTPNSLTPLHQREEWRCEHVKASPQPTRVHYTTFPRINNTVSHFVA